MLRILPGECRLEALFISDEEGEKKIYFCALDELIVTFTQNGHNIKTTGVVERRR